VAKGPAFVAGWTEVTDEEGFESATTLRGRESTPELLYEEDFNPGTKTPGCGGGVLVTIYLYNWERRGRVTREHTLAAKEFL